MCTIQREEHSNKTGLSKGNVFLSGRLTEGWPYTSKSSVSSSSEDASVLPSARAAKCLAQVM